MKNFKWQVIIEWFRENGRHNFPWRDYSYPIDTLLYRVWLAEILLQQTQADRVVPFYERILERYPSIDALAEASYEEFFPYYQGLGYYSRARNLLKTAKIVSEEYGGIFPDDIAKLKKLPGVGEYTARAILVFGYGEALLAWDTNLETIFARYYHGSKYEKLSIGEKGDIEKNLQEFLEPIKNEGQKNIIRSINNGLMDWARLSEPKTSANLDTRGYIFRESRFVVSEGTLEPILKKKTTTFPFPDATVIVILHRDHKVYYSDPIPNLSFRMQGGIDFSSTFKKKSKSSSKDDLKKDPYEMTKETLITHYSPFVLPPALHRDTRKYVQQYFREHYGLELSVRPVHKKWLSEDGKPYIAVNAQVQAGKVDFEEFSTSEFKTFTNSICKI